MREIVSWIPLSLLGIGFSSAVLILLNHDRPRFGPAWSFVAAVTQLVTAIGMLPAAFSDIAVVSPGLELLPGVTLRFRADPLGLLFLTLSSILWLITTAYSVGYLGGLRDRRQPGYYAAFAAAAASAAGVALAANPVTFLICYEALTLATWPLVVHKRTPGVLGSGRAYLAYTLFGGQLLLAAVVWAGLLAPDADFTAGGFLAGTAGDGSLRLLFVLFLIGVGVKAAIFPFHGWLPAAMVAPTPVSALLHAVAVVKAGAFGVLRLTGWVFGPELMRDLGLSLPLALLAGGDDPLRLAAGARRGPPEAAARLVDDRAALLHRPRRGDRNPARARRRRVPHRRPRLHEDHPLLLRRLRVCRHRQGADLRARRSRPGDADHLRRVRRGRARHGRDPVPAGIPQQVESRARRDRGGARSGSRRSSWSAGC